MRGTGKLAACHGSRLISFTVDWSLIVIVIVVVDVDGLLD